MNKKSEEEYSRLSRHLLECGCPLLTETGYRVKVVGSGIEQVASECNMIFDLDNGQTGYVMDLRITNECDRPLRSHGIQIKTPWGRADISLLPAPSKSNRKYEAYDFPNSGLTFHQSLVLNDFLSGARRLKTGDAIGGLLLGIDEKPIPSDLPEHGRTVVKFSIFDQRGDRFSSDFELCVDRGASCARSRREKSAVSGIENRRRRNLIVAA